MLNLCFFSIDGGPDENPRYPKVIEVCTHHFFKHDLDALFIATNAPGRSAYNLVERRMAPLSRKLCGLVLPYDNFGDHLDSQRRTTEEKLEKMNFPFAGIIVKPILLAASEFYSLKLEKLMMKRKF